MSTRYESLKALLLWARPDTLEPEKRACQICWSPYVGLEYGGSFWGEVPYRLPCGHVFGLECLFEWFIEESKNTCPMCRGEIKGLVDKEDDEDDEDVDEDDEDVDEDVDEDNDEDDMDVEESDDDESDEYQTVDEDWRAQSPTPATSEANSLLVRSIERVLRSLSSPTATANRDVSDDEVFVG